MKMIYKKLKMVCELCQNGREAVEMVANHHFDLVLMDIQIPDMSGTEALLIMREKGHKQTYDLHIIAVTVHALMGDREKFLI